MLSSKITRNCSSCCCCCNEQQLEGKPLWTLSEIIGSYNLLLLLLCYRCCHCNQCKEQQSVATKFANSRYLKGTHYIKLQPHLHTNIHATIYTGSIRPNPFSAQRWTWPARQSLQQPYTHVASIEANNETTTKTNSVVHSFPFPWRFNCGTSATSDFDQILWYAVGFIFWAGFVLTVGASLL